jgi:hypothetical protein
MKVVAPDLPWEQAKSELWRSCSSLGEPGTKEKERNIQIAILEQGTEITKENLAGAKPLGEETILTG